MATYKLQPDTGQISGGPHANMPLVVIPSELEIGAWTLAQAQSARFYTDAGLVTEVAREVVGADELHFKGTSVSSASEFWVDEDGVRSDYAVTDTYGSNAVWTNDYVAVYHDGGGTDSTGNGNTGTASGGVTIGGASGQMGDATDFDGINDYIDISALSEVSVSNTYAIQAWFNWDGSSNKDVIISITQASLNRNVITLRNNNIYAGIYDGSFNMKSVSFTDTSSFHSITMNWDTSAITAYLDNTVMTGTNIEGTEGTSHGAIGGTPDGTRDFKGIIDEVRILSINPSADWITTEYNNQNDNAGFWVVTSAGGGGSNSPLTADTASYTLTTNEAQITVNRLLSTETASYSVSDTETALRRSYSLSATSTAFTLTTPDTTLAYRRYLGAETSSFTLNTFDTAFKRTYAIKPETATFILTLSQAGLSTEAQLIASTANYTLTINEASLTVSRVLSTDPQSYTLDTQPADLLVSHLLSTEPQSFTLTGQDTDLLRNRYLAPETAEFIVTGIDAELLARLRLPVESAEYTLTGIPIALTTALSATPFCPMDSPFTASSSPFTDLPKRDCP